MFKRIRGERGFTLVELLVVLGILAILIGLVVPNLVAVLTRAGTTAPEQEREVVWSAIDTYNTEDVAINAQPTVQARSGFDVISSGSSDAPFTKYLRRLPTKYKYSWDAGGQNLKVATPTP